VHQKRFIPSLLRGTGTVSLLLTAALLLTAGVGCTTQATLSPSPSPVAATSTPTTGPVPTSTATSAAPTATPTSAPTETPTPTAEPSRPEALALYGAGPREEPVLYSLAPDGSTTGLGLNVYQQSAASRDGRWIASPATELPTDAVLITNLEAGTTYTVSVRPDFYPYGMAFDPEGTRLAFLELGTPSGEGTPWAIVLVNLEDGSTKSFEATSGPDNTLLPGSPVGWSGDDLLIDTFVTGTEQGSMGVWALPLPGGVEPAPIDSLDRREVLPGDDYLFTPELSPDGTRLLYLGRDYDYTPDDYEPVAFDVAVNRLGLLDIESGSSTLLVEETEGGALGMDAAWSPDGALGLFAEGRYGNGSFAALTLKTVAESGTMREVAPAPLPPGGFLVSLDWCAEGTALAVVADSEGVHELHTIEMPGGESSIVVSEPHIAVVGCVGPAADEGAEEGEAAGTDDASAGAADADVLQVRAVQTGGSEPGEGATTWTFHVTVEHPDTGWEDYANGWDVVTPEDEVLKPDPGDEFTRTLLHPHVDEQPFTRSQRGVVVPQGVTEVRVRAHDIVDGWGGQEVLVDLTISSGPNFEVERQ